MNGCGLIIRKKRNNSNCFCVKHWVEQWSLQCNFHIVHLGFGFRLGWQRFFPPTIIQHILLIRSAHSLALARLEHEYVWYRSMFTLISSMPFDYKQASCDTGNNSKAAVPLTRQIGKKEYRAFWNRVHPNASAGFLSSSSPPPFLEHRIDDIILIGNGSSIQQPMGRHLPPFGLFFPLPNQIHRTLVRGMHTQYNAVGFVIHVFFCGRWNPE